MLGPPNRKENDFLGKKRKKNTERKKFLAGKKRQSAVTTICVAFWVFPNRFWRETEFRKNRHDAMNRSCTTGIYTFAAYNGATVAAAATETIVRHRRRHLSRPSRSRRAGLSRGPRSVCGPPGGRPVCVSSIVFVVVVVVSYSHIAVVVQYNKYTNSRYTFVHYTRI